jgi:hypothetical protein
MVSELDSAPAGDGMAPLAASILGLVARVPPTREQAAPAAENRARAIAQAASLKASIAAGSLALPVGPLGWATILPELVTVWRIQSQMVSDIAGAYGRHAELTREHMLYCLFRYAAAQAVRGIAVRAGQGIVMQRLSSPALRGVAGQVALQFTQHIAHKGVSRWLPAIGAAAVGTYAWYDTRRVGDTAITVLGAPPAAFDDRAWERQGRPR